VLTRKVSSDAWSNVLTAIVYAPQSRLVKSATFGNGVNDWNTFTQDYELDVLGLYDGATTLINRAHTRSDGLNLTNIFDNVTPANNASLWYSPANRLQNRSCWRRRFTSRAEERVTIGARGPWGSETFYGACPRARPEEWRRKPHRAPRHAAGRVADHRDARLPRHLEPRHADHAERELCLALPIHASRRDARSDRSAGALHRRSLSRRRPGMPPATPDRFRSPVATGSGAGITSDSRLGSLYAYTYNKANRLKTVSYEGNLKATYTYNGLHQLITRVVTNSGSLDGTTHYVHDRSGNVIAELNAAGATVREYIWLPEAEIAPTAASRAQIDRPVAVVDGVNATPATYYVHTDHLHRPSRMSNAAKAFVWSAEYQPWGAVQSLSGALTLDARFPGLYCWSTFGKPMSSEVPARAPIVARSLSRDVNRRRQQEPRLARQRPPHGDAAPGRRTAELRMAARQPRRGGPARDAGSHAAEVGLRFLAGVRQAGHAPGDEAVAEQLVHLAALDAGLMADVVDGGDGGQARILGAQGVDQLPVALVEPGDALLAGEVVGQLLGPEREVADQAILVEQRRLGQFHGDCGHGSSPFARCAPPWRCRQLNEEETTPDEMKLL
jgi:hypothetical protein